MNLSDEPNTLGDMLDAGHVPDHRTWALFLLDWIAAPRIVGVEEVAQRGDEVWPAVQPPCTLRGKRQQSRRSKAVA